MIEAHSFDAWTRPDEKARDAYAWLMMLGGMGAPLFLFLAGVAVALSAAARVRRGASAAEASRQVQRRGWQIFLYAFLFRLQSYVLGGFSNIVGLLKVDVLNIMGPSIAAAAALWAWGSTRVARALVLTVATVVVALLTPPLRAWSGLEWLPDPIQWYVRPEAGHTNFTLLPWGAFVLAGTALGICLEGATGRWSPPRLQLTIAAVAAGLVGGCYWASWQPSIYSDARFWTTSPAFFGLRVGLMLLAVTAAWAWSVRPWRRPEWTPPLEVFGKGSLFVYWVHVELVYGVVGLPLRERLSLEEGIAAWLALAVVMYGLLAAWTASREARWQAWGNLRKAVGRTI
jgi:uncharacterized membrane protein